MMTELLAFAGIMALGQFSPGPDMVLLTRTALKEGGKAGVAMAWGIACGLAVHATVAVAGFALVFAKVAALREVLRWAAVVYLLWLAWSLLRERFAAGYSKGEVGEAPQAEVRGSFLRGLFCNLLNPKAALFLAAVSAPFLVGERPDGWPVAIWSIVVFQGGILWMLWAGLLQWKPLRLWYGKAAPWIDGCFGVALAGLAVHLAMGGI